MQRDAMKRARLVQFCSVLALTGPAVLAAGLTETAHAQQCHPANSEDISSRGDIVNLRRVRHLIDEEGLVTAFKGSVEADAGDGLSVRGKTKEEQRNAVAIFKITSAKGFFETSAPVDTFRAV